MLPIGIGNPSMRNRRFDTIVTLVCLALLGYFAWHASKGPRGFGFRDGLSAQASAHKGQLAEIDTRRLDLEHRVSLLRPESIDPDMLDELARSQLEMAGPSDLVVMFPG